MIVMPAVDVRDGACVQLVGGDYHAERVRLPDPAGVAAGWRTAGFTEIHVVDLDAATGQGHNTAALAAIVSRLGGGVQVGGGVRSTERVDTLIASGVDRVVVGTRALEDPAWLATIAEAYPDRIVVAADVRGREVVTRGWATGTGRSISDVLASLDPLPLAGVLVTAVHVEGSETGADLALTAWVVKSTRHPVQASGGIRDIDDLKALRAAGAARAVAGMAFYTGHLDREAVALEYGT